MYNSFQCRRHLLPFCGVLQHITLKTKVEHKKRENNPYSESLLLLESFSGCLWQPVKLLKHACCIFNCHFKCQNPEVLLILYVNTVSAYVQTLRHFK